MSMHLEHLKQVVFIASCWHSGSTLLDFILGSHTQLTSTGELSKATEFFRGDYGESLCTCNIPLRECPFWQGVERHLAERLHNSDFSLGAFPTSIMPDRPSMHRAVPNAIEILMLLGSRRAWNIARKLRPNHDGFQAARNTVMLLDAIAKQANVPIVVDSSKQPGQLKGLYLTIPDRFKVIFLTRDGRANALSQKKADGFDLETAAKRWIRFNRNLLAVMSTIPPSQIYNLRYEDLCQDPKGTLESICHFLGIPPHSQEDIEIDKSKYHVIGGNPMRYRSSESRIVLDEKWKRELSAGEISSLDSIVGTMNSRFGYEPWISAG